MPPRLRKKLYERLVGIPYEHVVALLQDRASRAGADLPDAQEIALILVEGLSAYRAMRETFGRVPGDVDDESMIGTWVDIAMTMAEARGLVDSNAQT